MATYALLHSQPSRRPQMQPSMSSARPRMNHSAPYAEDRPDLNHYRQLVVGTHCVNCGRRFSSGTRLVQFEHEDGWRVDGFSHLQWLAVDCDCGYRNSLWQLGIPGCNNTAHNDAALVKMTERVNLMAI